MRADRLISILTTLQARGRATASGLAEENQVSLRTIYRDIGALAMAGIPVYAERGSQGGYLLLNGYKVQLNGMSAGEASALFLSGLGNTATGLGLDAAILRAEKKFAAALPEAMRNDILGSRTRHPRIYKIMRIQLLEVIDGSFAALEDFNLASYWEANTEAWIRKYTPSSPTYESRHWGCGYCRSCANFWCPEAHRDPCRHQLPHEPG